MKSALILAILPLVLMASFVEATTWFMEDDGSGDAPHLQAAIDSSAPGDTILLNDGFYSGPGNQIFIVNHTLTFRSVNGPLVTRIILLMTPGFTINAPNCLIEGITVDRGSDVFGGAVTVNSGNFTTRNSWYTNCLASAGGGIFFNTGASGTGRIIDCVFESCVANFAGSAVWAFNGVAEVVVEGCVISGGTGLPVVVEDLPLTVRNCTFVENEPVGGDPLALGSVAGSITVENTLFAFNTGVSPPIISNGALTISCSNMFGNHNGGTSLDWTGKSAPFANINDNFSEDPQFCDMIFKDFQLAASSPCAPGNHPDGAACGLVGALDVGCGGNTATEEASWTDVKEMFR
ncbi:MAG: hypothetical protein HKN20_12110 [Gemmatimonadetes bacterium]|nr:hypothetical protein [Gemmatimonadota bacterium]